MAITDKKITPEQIAQYGVVSAPDTLMGTADENKKIFDRLVREIVAESVNAAIDSMSEVETEAQEWSQAEAERKASETGRENAESIRVSAEAARFAAEVDRASAELIRKAAETGRISDEQARQAQETIRQAEFKNLMYWNGYSPNREYIPGEKVSLNGRSYLCIEKVKGIAPPGATWLLIADRGDRGDAGETGAQGESGAFTPSTGIFGLSVDSATGEVFVHIADGTETVPFSMDLEGNIYAEIAD